MESDARLELEGIGEAVLALRIFADQGGLDGAGVGELEQGFIDVAVEGLVDALAGAGGIVEVLRLVERADADGGVGVELLRQDGRREGDAPKQAGGQQGAAQRAARADVDVVHSVYSLFQPQAEAVRPPAG